MKAFTKRHKGGRRGHLAFTLIELLVVIAVILILVGISLKVMSLANRKAGITRTTWILEQVKNSLAAYYATYGTYPPVNSVYYEYESTPMSALPAVPTDPGYRTGLVYFIFSGTYHNPEAEGWQHFLDGIGNYGSPRYSNQVGFAWVAWTNSSHTIYDAFGNELHYESPYPYSTYRLWSDGPNRANNNGSGDDQGVTSVE